MIKYIYLFFLSILFIPFLSAQEMDHVLKANVYGNPYSAANQLYIKMLNHNKSMSDIEHLITYDDWQPIEIYGRDTDMKLSMDSANYNYCTDQFFAVYMGEKFFVSSDKVSKVLLGPDEFKVYPYYFDKELKQGFFQVIVDGEFPLLKRIFLKKEVVNNDPMKTRESEVVTYAEASEMYYFNARTKVVEKLPTNKKKFINVFRSNRNKLVKYAEKHDISPKREVDVVRFFMYNNMLIKEKQKNAIEIEG